jgi:putative flippase GtrA
MSAMSTEDAGVSHWHRAVAWLRSGGAVRLFKYGLGSIVAAVSSALAFALCYAAGLHTTPASAIAFVAGAVPNYILNRRWAWQRTGKVDVWREIVIYTVVSLVSFLAAAAATGATSHAVKHLDISSTSQTLLVTGAYVATYALLFFAKFLCFEVYVFAGRQGARRAANRSDTESRHQVAAMARANRAP